MSPLPRFLLGLALGAAAAGVTHAIEPAREWWWAVGLIVAALIWFGELLDISP